MTDASLVQWRFAFEAVIPEGTYADLPWAKRSYREFALKRPLGDVLAFVLPAAPRADVPVGSLVSILVGGWDLRI